MIFFSLLIDKFDNNKSIIKLHLSIESLICDEVDVNSSEMLATLINIKKKSDKS